MLSIDEAIAHAREVANEQKRRNGVCIQNDSECDKFSACLKCAEEHEQLAEWLEELKAYRKIGTVEECRTSILEILNAYFLGVRSAEDDAYSRGCLSGIELGKKEVLCGITSEDAKSMICTLDMLKRLAFNIHGVIDVIDDRNIEKMRKVLSQLN